MLNSVYCLDADGGQVVAGSVLAYAWNSGNPHRGGLSVLDSGASEWQFYDEEGGLPNNRITAVKLEGSHLWVGGKGYLALLDRFQRNRISYSQFRGDVTQIEIGPAHVWIAIDHHLFRIPQIPNFRD